MPAPALLAPLRSTKLRRRRKPLLAGNGLVKIYRTRWRDKSRRRIYRSHTLAWRDAGGRHREKRNTLAAAQARAKELAECIVNGRIALDQVSPADWATLQRAQELLRPMGESLELAISKYTEFVQILRALSPAPSFRDLADFWRLHHPAGQAPMSCPDILTEMLKRRKAAGASRNTLADYTSRLGKFIEDFTGPLLSITAAELNTWLGNLDVSRRTRNNYRGNLVDLYRYARQAGYLPKGWAVLDDVPRVKNEAVKIEIFTPEEIVRIIAARIRIEERAKRARRPCKHLIPYLAIGAWAGCRHEEMSAPGEEVLDWRNIDFANEEIWVPEGVARKIRKKRVLPMQPNLVAWLRPHARNNGPICDIANTTNALAEAAAEAKPPVKWKDNGLRRSYISYRLAATDNVGQVAREAGTSPRIIDQHYDKVATRRESKRWFDIWPTKAEILQLPLAL